MITLRNGSVWQLINDIPRLNSSCKFPSMWNSSKQWFIAPVIVILALFLSVGCGNDDTPADSPMTQPMSTSPEDVVITIGNLTDLTSVSSNAMDPINKSLKDMVEYYNDEKLIPGVKLKIETYDEQYDPSKDKPGYEWLKERGADVIWAAPPPVAPSLASVVDRDQFPLFSATATLDILVPPGYTFSLGTIPQYDIYTLLTWIAENDWDYETNGPAKIGGAAWTDAYSDAVFEAMEDYADAHPEQFEFVGGLLTDFTFIWGPQIEELKDCDYLWTPVPMHVFVEAYRKAGYTAKFIGSDPHAAFMGMIDKGKLWEEIDGMLFIRGSRWWTEEGKIIDLTRKLLFENHSGEAEDIMRSGVGYLATSQMYQLCNIIRNAAEKVGPENVTSQTIYDATVTYTESIDGIDRYSFDDTKRCSTNYYVVYEVRSEGKNLFRADPDWLPLVLEP